MNINNLNTTTKPSISIAAMLTTGLNTNFSIEKPITRKKSLVTNLGQSYDHVIYLNKEGEITTRKALADTYGVTCRHVYDMFKASKGDYLKAIELITTTSKTVRNNMKYKDRHGHTISIVKISVREKISQAKVTKYFTEAKFNHAEAYLVIDSIKARL